MFGCQAGPMTGIIWLNHAWKTTLAEAENITTWIVQVMDAVNSVPGTRIQAIQATQPIYTHTDTRTRSCTHTDTHTHANTHIFLLLSDWNTNSSVFSTFPLTLQIRPLRQTHTNTTTATHTNIHKQTQSHASTRKHRYTPLNNALKCSEQWILWK